MTRTPDPIRDRNQRYLQSIRSGERKAPPSLKKLLKPRGRYCEICGSFLTRPKKFKRCKRCEV